MPISRRRMLRASAALAGLAIARSQAADAREVRHAIPAVSHDAVLLKVSFAAPPGAAPLLRIGSRRIEGMSNGSSGRFFQFLVRGLTPATTHELVLEERDGTRLLGPWRLRTFPAPGSMPERCRVLVYTCAGGDESTRAGDDRRVFQPLSVRRALLARALSFSPDLAIGIGDQVYWDQVSVLERGTEAQRRAARERYAAVGHFDRTLPVHGTMNETVLTTVGDRQIADLYRTTFLETPLYLTQDDHDYFENDEANDQYVTFPPDPFNLALARTTQQLYFPEFLPDSERPAGLPGANAADRAHGLSESYGTVRFGDLLECLIYDCRRFVTLAGPSAVFVHPVAESWLGRRTQDESRVRHLVHVPSTPFGWTAGKWGEWYADYLDEHGRLGTGVPKPYWQSGWRRQHDRLLHALAAQTARIPLVVSGDLHALGSGDIVRAADSDLPRKVTTILSGPVSTDELAWPSAFRGTGPQVPSGLEVEARLSPVERNGFTLLDFANDTIEVRQFAWDSGMSVAAIDTLEPVHAFRLARRTS